ncbi:hypothetical protein F4680DRAFT_429491 [Xylaria scruposa]|nr:hypothetical protein F4680DRAFT_429491 [Xylaria scruposa]
MHHNDSRTPQRKSMRNGETIRSVSRNYSDHRVYQAPLDSENAYNLALFDGALQAAQKLVPDLLPSASPSLMSATVSTNSNACWPTVQQLSSVPFGPDISISDYQEFSRTSGNSSLHMLSSSAVEPLNPFYTTAPAYDSSFWFPANEAVPNGIDNGHLNQPCAFDPPVTTATLTAPAYDSSPLPPANESASNGVDNWRLSQPYNFNSPLTATTPAPCVSDVSLRPYQCSSCPNRPAFSSQKDLKRHLLAKAHWNDSTQFYRCCCGARSPRKDNHKTHMRTCDELTPDSYSYACKCGIEQSSQDKHIKHIEDCNAVTSIANSPLPLTSGLSNGS